MASAQIEQLRKHFIGLNTAHKKQFIENLQKQIKNNGSAEHKSFLRECINRYNTENNNNNSSVIVPKPTSQSRMDDNVVSSNSIAEPAQRLIAYILDILLSIPLSFLSIYMNTLSDDIRYWDSSNMRQWSNADFYKIHEMGSEYYIRFYDSLVNEYRIVAIVVIIYFILYIVLQLFFWAKGMSFGKKIMKLIVINKDTGNKISFGYMALRETIGKFISGFLLIGYIWILIDKDRQGWHDKLVSSIVIKRK